MNQENNTTVRELLKADAKNPHTTRPKIALGAFYVVAFVTIATISLWAYGVLAQNDVLVKTVMDGWPFILAVIGPLVTLLWAYFGVLKQEQRNRLDAATGAPSGISRIISDVINRK